MKLIIAFAALIAVAVAAPPVSSSKDATVLKYENENIGVEGYHFAVDTSDGLSRTEDAVVKNVGTENESLEIHGAYTYVDLDGKTYTLKFTADEEGFKPEADYLPK